MTTRNRIVLDGGPNRRYEEGIAGVTLKPGHLLYVSAAGTPAPTVGKHNVSGGVGQIRVAQEDSLQGNVITTAFAIGDLVPQFMPQKGDRFLARLPIGQNIAAFAKLMSDGAGCLIAATGGVDVSKLYSSVAASAAVTNTVTETAFDKSYTIPANYLAAGDVIRIRGQAIASATHSTDTLTLKLKIGTQVIIATAAVDVADGDIGFFQADLTIRTIGASGTFVASGEQGLGVPGTVTAKPFLLGSTAIDTTATKLVSITATWSVADTGNSARLDVLTVELLRAGTQNAIVESQEAVDNSAGSDEAFISVMVL